MHLKINTSIKCECTGYGQYKACLVCSCLCSKPHLHKSLSLAYQQKKYELKERIFDITATQRFSWVLSKSNKKRL